MAGKCKSKGRMPVEPTCPRASGVELSAASGEVKSVRCGEVAWRAMEDAPREVTELLAELGIAGRGAAFVLVPEGESVSIFAEVGGNTPAERYCIVQKDASLTVRELVLGAVNNAVADNAADGAYPEVAADNAGVKPVAATTYIVCATGAKATVVTAELGSGEVSLRYRSFLIGEGAEYTHSGLFIAADGERKSVDVRVDHLVPGGRSNVVVKGVASGDGQGSFAGMVYVAPDAQHTEAYQQSRNILLGDAARITASPQLEIYADDVKCSHGATVGRQDDDAVYYMRQRGLGEDEARRLQLGGFVNDIVMRMGDDDVARRIEALAWERIEKL